MDPQKLDVNESAPQVERNEENKHVLQILLTYNQLKKIKQNLNAMIDSLAENPSILSRASKLWGTIPWWQKLLAGLVLTIPLLLVGIFAQLAVLTAISICVMVTYTISSLALDNHQAHNTNNTARLKSCIGNMADLLGASIQLLQGLQQLIAKQIDAFHTENNKLTQKIIELTPQVEDLTQKVEGLQQVKQTLGKTIEDLEQTLQVFKTSGQEQIELFEQTKHELEQVKSSYEDNEKKLSTSINELTDHNANMQVQLNLARSIAMTLNDAVATFSAMILADEQQRSAFSERLANTLNNKEQCFIKVLNQFNHSERNLKTITNQLVDLNNEYDAVLDRFEIVTRLMEEKLGIVKITPPEELEQQNKIKPSINGFYSDQSTNLTSQGHISSFLVSRQNPGQHVDPMGHTHSL